MISRMTICLRHLRTALLELLLNDHVAYGYLVAAVDEFCGHKSGISTLIVNGKWLVTGGSDNRVLIFDLDLMTLRISLREQLQKDEEYSLKMTLYQTVIEEKLKKKNTKNKKKSTKK